VVRSLVYVESLTASSIASGMFQSRYEREIIALDHRLYRKGTAGFSSTGTLAFAGFTALPLGAQLRVHVLLDLFRSLFTASDPVKEQLCHVEQNGNSLCLMPLRAWQRACCWFSHCRALVTDGCYNQLIRSRLGKAVE